MFHFSVYVYMIILVALLGLAFGVFSRVKRDYKAYGKLTRSVSVLQTGFFVIYALCSYVFLDSRLSQVKVDAWTFPLVCLLMLVGFIVVILSMPFLGKTSFGNEVGKLRADGLYHTSRNPQLVGGFLFIVGYALLWPSWQGYAWAAIWLVVSPLMVRGEEEHLARVFGNEYMEYCARVPRYIGKVHNR